MRVRTGTRRGLRGRLLTTLALAAFTITAATGAAGPASAAPEDGRAPSALAYDVRGTWTDIGIAWPEIYVYGDTVFIDMYYARRPNATGRVLDSSTILVTFPDDNTYLGTFLSPTYLSWSNGTAWQKVFTGPQIFDLEGIWFDNRTNRHVANIGMGHGLFQLDLASSVPHGAAFATSATTIRATFPGHVLRLGTLQAPNILNWSNGDQWRRIAWVDVPPGNPQCLRPASLLC